MRCTCPQPFGEDDLICPACEKGERELYERLFADQLPTGDDWDAYTRQQG